ncbi:hypothetical protein [Methylibium petroleiphilum]|uniref:hypothetical protein n=1 Tax=Methylibium petroleiphilum TaxID=105560 RepID=UPI001AC403A1|nr:hypothetical protein [Methylibium petroleiphilum]MBN9206675.1 hypothetical protein [Methylibium petroleiphilum]
MAEPAFDLLKQHANVGRVRLVPPTLSFDPDAVRLKDHTWLPSLNADGGLRLNNCTTGHVVDITGDDVRTATRDEAAPWDGLSHFRVVLNRRLALRGARAWWIRQPPASATHL